MTVLRRYIISNLLKPVSETHNRAPRSSANGTQAVPRSRSSVFDRSFSYSAPRLWNSFLMLYATHHL